MDFSEAGLRLTVRRLTCELEQMVYAPSPWSYVGRQVLF